MTRSHTQRHVDQPVRTGPVSRLVRVVLAGLLGAGVYGLLETGMSNFSDPEILTQPGFWLITVLAVQNVYAIPEHLFGPVWGRRNLVGFLAVAAVAATIALATAGILWAAPLTWLLYPLELVVFALVTLAFAVSALQGTPGCELDALRELTVRPRADAVPAAPCVLGLHRLDLWEARQSWHRGTDRP